MSDQEAIEEAAEETPRKANVGKLAALGLVVFVLSIPMFVGVAKGVSNGDVFDPVTGERVVAAPDGIEGCESAAALLMRDASKADDAWSARRQEWRAECAEKKPVLDRMIDTALGEGSP